MPMQNFGRETNVFDIFLFPVTLPSPQRTNSAANKASILQQEKYSSTILQSTMATEGEGRVHLGVDECMTRSLEYVMIAANNEVDVICCVRNHLPC